MAVVESLLLTTLLFSCGYASYFDIKKGIIPNKLILISAIPVIILDVIYYSVFAREYFKLFVINFVILSVLSVLMYALNLWAAGDSKLLFLIVLAIPGRMYSTEVGARLSPALFIVVLTFSVAFVYVILESAFLIVKNKTKISPDISIKTVLQFLKQYYCCFIYISFINYGITLLFPTFTANNSYLIIFLNLFLAIVISKFKFFFKKIPIIVFSVLTISLMVFYYVRNPLSEPNIKVYIYLAVLLILRSIAEKFNYKEIATADVKQGMILSYGTVLSFVPSKVKGLPEQTTEDMRSRITREEAESILRWKDSKYGEETITIVRKIPFAIFMSIGSLLYIILRIGVL